MPRVMNHLTRTVAAFAIAALPAVALAQTPRAAAQPNPAAEHLTAARAALNRVLNAPAPSGDAFKKLSDIKAHYIALEKAVSTASPEWNTHYKEIDRLLTELLGAPSGEPGAVGTSGRAGAPAVKGLDPAVTANLEDFRTHLAGFSAAMSGVAAAPSARAATSSPAAPATPAAAAPAAPAASPTPAAAPATSPAPAAPAAASPAPASPATPPSTTPDPAAAPTTPAAPAAPATSTTPAAASAPTDSTSLAAQVDQVMLLVDTALASNAQQIDRATLEQIKTQLEQIRQRVKK